MSSRKAVSCHGGSCDQRPEKSFDDSPLCFNQHHSLRMAIAAKVTKYLDALGVTNQRRESNFMECYLSAHVCTHTGCRSASSISFSACISVQFSYIQVLVYHLQHLIVLTIPRVEVQLNHEPLEKQFDKTIFRNIQFIYYYN